VSRLREVPKQVEGVAQALSFFRTRGKGKEELDFINRENAGKIQVNGRMESSYGLWGLTLIHFLWSDCGGGMEAGCVKRGAANKALLKFLEKTKKVEDKNFNGKQSNAMGAGTEDDGKFLRKGKT